MSAETWERDSPCACGGRKGWRWPDRCGPTFFHETAVPVARVETTATEGEVLDYNSPRTTGAQDCDAWLDRWVAGLHEADAYAGRAIASLNAAGYVGDADARARGTDRMTDIQRRNEGRRLPPRDIRGREFAVTGVIEGYSRESAERAIRARGGYTHDTVRATSDALIVGVRPGAAKLARAKLLLVPEIDAQGFYALIRASGPPDAAPREPERGPTTRPVATDPPFGAELRRQERESARARARAMTDPITPARGTDAPGRPEETAADRLLDRSRERRGPREW